MIYIKTYYNQEHPSLPKSKVTMILYVCAQPLFGEELIFLVHVKRNYGWYIYSVNRILFT